MRGHRRTEAPGRIVERTSDVAQRKTEAPQQADPVQPLDVGVGVEPVAGFRASRRRRGGRSLRSSGASGPSARSPPPDRRSVSRRRRGRFWSRSLRSPHRRYDLTSRQVQEISSVVGATLDGHEDRARRLDARARTAVVRGGRRNRPGLGTSRTHRAMAFVGEAHQEGDTGATWRAHRRVEGSVPSGRRRAIDVPHGAVRAADVLDVGR